MKRPLVYILVFFVCGIIAGSYFSTMSGIFLCAAAICAAIAIFLKFRIYPTLLLPLVAIVGLFVTLCSTTTDPIFKALLQSGNNVSVCGTTLETSESAYGTGIARVNVIRVQIGDKIYRTNADIMVYAKEKIFSPNELVILSGTLSPPEPQRNPGCYDEARYYLLSGITCKMNVSKCTATSELAWRPRWLLASLRARLCSVFDLTMPETEANIMKSIVIGDKTGLEPQSEDLFQKAGIYHILAISGLHVSILANFLSRLTTRLMGKKRGGAVFAVILLFYCILTGAGVATVRAVIMAIVGLIGDIIGRQSDHVTNISLSALLILLFKPLYLWMPGFQYTFSAVLALGLLPRAFDPRMAVLGDKKGHYLRRSLISSISALCGVSPVMAWHFYYISPIGILLNLLVIPLMPILVIFGFIMCITGLFTPIIAEFVAPVCTLIIRLFHFLCSAGLKIPFSYVVTGKPPLSVILLFVALLAAFAAAFSVKKPKSSLYWVAGLCSIMLAIFASIWLFKPPKFSVTMLDVGQGDATVVSYGRQAVLIDGGGSANAPEGSSTGHYRVIPFLKYLGIQSLDAVFISHSDADHSVGAIETIRAMPCSTLYLSVATSFENEGYAEQLKLAAKDSGAKIYAVSKGHTLPLIGGAYVDILHPGEKELTGNESSLVMRIIAGNAIFLFTGDIDEKVERALVSDGSTLKADVLKVAHHGSRFSSSKSFLESVDPKIAIISAGKSNVYGHPSPETLERLKQAKAHVFVTKDCGAICVTTDGGEIMVDAYVRESD